MQSNGKTSLIIAISIEIIEFEFPIFVYTSSSSKLLPDSIHS